MTSKILLAAVIALSLGGCSLAPGFMKPETPVPENWSSARLAAAEKISTDWWRSFDDPALVALVEEALGANNDLQLAAARVAEARALLTGQQAERYPLLEVEGAAVRQEPSEETDTAGTRGITDTAGTRGGQPFNDLQVSGVLSYELDLWGRLANASEAARARLLASAANREAVRLAVIGEVANGYFNLRALDRQIEIAERTMASRRESVALQRTRFEGGDVDELALRQAESELAAAESELPRLRQQRTRQRNALAVLLGRNPHRIIKDDITVADAIDAINAPASVPAGRPADLIVRRPDIAAAEQELVATNAEIGVARAAFLPRISFVGLLGLQSASGGDLFQGSASAWQLGGSLVGPLLDFGRAEALVDQAEARQRQALITYRQTIQTAFQEVLDALAGMRRAEERLQAQARQVAALRSTAELARLRFEGGISSYLEVLDAERSLFTTELDLVETQRDRLQSTVNLYRALGGGWQGPSNAQAVTGSMPNSADIPQDQHEF
ncbi:efflux transporter outer membrane subunit [Minwuia thermotolerans]|uniref:RND transporter n=1 Tax=Minwuia thermotolerans TaxID=2056226 RepID=A0A2M9G562_9PROT|nr:efflux transporter outer membrane subunit [Minwuia thermotolerans]PJK30855.1 RND transporter [Minwuia thermotolerans]